MSIMRKYSDIIAINNNFPIYFYNLSLKWS